MRLLVIILLALAATSCGKKDGGGSVSAGPAVPRDTRAENTDTGKFGIEVTPDMPSIEFTGITMDAPIQIMNNQIIFQRSASLADSQNRTTCSMAVKSGEVFEYALVGDKLEISTDSGRRFTLKRVIRGTDLIGSWTSITNENNVTIRRRFAFVNPQRLIIRQECEG